MANRLGTWCREPSPAATWKLTSTFTRDASREPTARRRPRGPRIRSPWARTLRGKTSSLAESQFVDTFPFPVTLEVLEHGRDRFMIYCVVCHDPMGTGRGKIVERGYTPPPSYHIARLRKRPGRTHLRRDQRGIRFDALLRRSDLAARPVGHRGLRAGPAAQPAFSSRPTHARNEKRNGNRHSGERVAVSNSPSPNDAGRHPAMGEDGH